MTITQAQSRIDAQLKAGLISQTEAQRRTQLIRRTGAYGNKWSWTQQSAMRAIVVGA